MKKEAAANWGNFHWVNLGSTIMGLQWKIKYTLKFASCCLFNAKMS